MTRDESYDTILEAAQAEFPDPIVQTVADLAKAKRERLEELRRQNVSGDLFNEEAERARAELVEKAAALQQKALADATAQLEAMADEHRRQQESYPDRVLIRQRAAEVEVHASGTDELERIAERYADGSIDLPAYQLNLIGARLRQDQSDRYPHLREAMRIRRASQPWTREGDGLKAYNRTAMYSAAQPHELVLPADDPSGSMRLDVRKLI